MICYDISVSGQEMTLSNDSIDTIIVEGSQQFVKFRFTLDENWDGLTVFAQFIQNGEGYNVYLDGNNTVELPPEIVRGMCLLVLYGSMGTTIATTNAIILSINDYRLVADGQSVVITESLYNQIVDMIGDIASVLDTINGEVI